MFIKNQFIQNKLVLHLMEKEKFELLTTSSNQTEYLLWRTNKRVTDIVRVSLTSYDWKRDLDRDVDQLEKRVADNIQLPFFQQRIAFHHVFIVNDEPVDDWDALQSRKSNVKKIDHSYVYMITEHTDDEFPRFVQKVKLELSLDWEPITDVFQIEYNTSLFKRRIQQIYHNKQKEMQSVFSHGKPRLSYLLIGINIIIFFLLELSGGSTNIETLVKFGAKYNVAIIDGEWWRIITSMFLHIGIIHLALNMLAIYFIGTLVERIYGSTRFIIIYFLAGIAGGVTSFAWNPSIAAGASGAIFGLFGALLFFGLKNPRIFFRTMGMNVLVMVAINVVFGFSVEQIDNGAHIGGLIGGFIASGIVMLPNTKVFMQQLMAIVVYLFYIVGILTYGV
ncbi:rhomboid family intramembrane serine protease [Gracilibacillus sp. S3-1-1]|uniref:Rhomboid family intramembrane serine protease n=1 Tax=Gracilibacillus pellucidus TaxID=3095368 RepID=A0ACC6M5C6_9BACI|nr:rhomboid family intramembrane serine protease [Gracilibacillus sp. S3-1-1]MDX8045987.1 rhomboid family intramembrane serine protease [Gracilibacillus sp. S3-1-1]